jgi:5-methylcytosine-specific restriction endonuclease McrA
MKISNNVPKALREQVWIKYMGKKFSSKCFIKWCKNEIDVFSFHVGHNIPDSKGGLMILENLRPICARCNLSMGNHYTIDQWQQLGGVNNTSCFCC